MLSASSTIGPCDHAPQPYTSKVFKDFKNGRVVPYTLSNDDPNYKATYDMTSALVASTNTYYVALEDALGSVTPVVQTSKAMGMHYDYPTQDSADKIIKNKAMTPDFNTPGVVLYQWAQSAA